MPADEIMSWAWVAWLGLILLFAVIEMLTLDFVFIMFALGSVGGLVLSLFGAPLWAQVVVAAVLAVALLQLVRPRLLRRLHRGADPAKSNVDAVIGISARAVGDFSEGRGLAKLANGETWTARLPRPVVGSPDSPQLAADPLDGELLVVESIDGATAVVARAEETRP